MRSIQRSRSGHGMEQMLSLPANEHPRPSVGLRRPASSGRYTQGDSLRNLQYEWYHYRGQVTHTNVKMVRLHA